MQKSITYILGFLAIFSYAVVDVFVYSFLNIYVVVLITSFLVAFKLRSILLPLSYGFLMPILIVLLNLLKEKRLVDVSNEEFLMATGIIFVFSFFSSLAGIITAFGLSKKI